MEKKVLKVGKLELSNEPIIAERETLDEAIEYFHSCLGGMSNNDKASAMVGVGVLLNTIVSLGNAEETEGWSGEYRSCEHCGSKFLAEFPEDRYCCKECYITAEEE